MTVFSKIELIRGPVMNKSVELSCDDLQMIHTIRFPTFQIVDFSPAMNHLMGSHIHTLKEYLDDDLFGDFSYE